jgi:hypothetical protein
MSRVSRSWVSGITTRVRTRIRVPVTSGAGTPAQGLEYGVPELPVHNWTIWRPWESQSSDYPPARNRRYARI